MRYLYLILGLYFAGLLSVEAQMNNGLYGNEWIDYSRTYYKFGIWADGWYRIPAQALQNAGLAGRAAEGFRLQSRGQDVPLYVHAPTGTVEYIEFYGQRNRGELYENLYVRAAHHFNPQYSLISDTAVYYLSWAASGGGALITERSPNLSNLPPALTSYPHEEVLVLNSTWNPGKTYAISGEQLRKSSFDFGEGYGSALSTQHNVSIPSSRVVPGGQAELEYRFYSPAVINHVIEARVGGSLVASTSFAGDSVLTLRHSFAASLLQSPSTSVQVRGANGQTDWLYLSYAILRYNREFSFDNALWRAFRLAASTQRQYLEITQFNGGTGQSIYLYDLQNRQRSQCFWDGTRVRVDLPPSAQARDLVLVNTGNASAFGQVGGLQEVQFTNYQQQPADYLILSHRRLRTSSQGGDPIFEYAVYRASTGYNPLIVDVEELYDQFGYGVHSHPLALRNFAQYVQSVWPAGGREPHIFLIGKGRAYTAVRTLRTLDHLVPSFGSPPVDNLMFARNGEDAPIFPVGRLAATSGEQVRTYLQKVQDLEAARNAPQTLADRGWMKRILHLGGGSNQFEQNLIRNSLDGMKVLAQGPDYGANVESFFKSSAAPIQAAQSAYLDSLINSGVSMISFFGHSSANSFDFNLDYPERYTNYQRYPFIMALGCYGGTVYEAAPGISERFIFEPRAGASVFLASVGAATLNALGQFGNQFYQNLSPRNYGKTGAQHVKESIAQLQGSFLYTLTMQMACQYMVYHGDPVLDLQAQPAPDYYINASLVSHEPAQVSSQLNEFELVLDIRNLGQALDTAFNVSVYRTMPNGQRNFVARERVAAPHHQRILRLSIPTEGNNGLGLNLFDIFIDSEDEVVEAPLPQAEQNNQVIAYPVMIISEDIMPVYPYEFAIVPNQGITLKASTGNALAPLQTYVVQIDTTAYFNSPVFRETRITQVGGLVEWTPSLTYLDSTVYYWRVSRDSLNPNQGYRWGQSSFVYLAGSFPGWNQSHFFQFKRDNFLNLELEEPGRRFEYVSTVQELTLLSGFTPTVIHPERVASYLNGSLVDRCRCPNDAGVFVQVIDPSDLSFWSLLGQQSRYGAVNCDASTNRRGYNFLFRTAQSAPRQALEQFIRDTIPNGHFVLLYSLNNASPQLFSPGLVQVLQDQGAQHLQDWIQSQGQHPYAFFFRKGDSSFVHKQSVLGASPTSLVEISGLMPGNWSAGQVESTVIGPVRSWGSVHWRYREVEPNDALSLEVEGLDASGQVSLLYTGLQSLDTMLTGISAAQYPFLRLRWRSADPTSRSASQLHYWRILAEPLPEAALRPDLFYAFNRDTIYEGQNLSVAILSQNISELDMDSMLIKFQIIGQPPVYQRHKPLVSGDTLRTTVAFPSLGLQGPQQLFVELNPNSDQPERYHFNNLALIPFFVQRDRLNPLVDVTFDGRHILNGDLVSAKPEIVIQLSDENRFLPLNEPQDLRLILRHPSLAGGEMLLEPSNTDMDFVPASSSEAAQGRNKARMTLRPNLPHDGRYTLQVGAKDRSGNNSGRLDYSVDFEVIRQSSISNMLNYPNPFTTSTQFVFTLTGSELPEMLRIQIFTVSGKLVREIEMEELGPLRIGLNRTAFAWDGTDQFGDRLANGVYLYRVIARKDGQDMNHFQNQQTDQFFKQGFGKMYLMR